jgi:hypothetical protein
MTEDWPFKAAPNTTTFVSRHIFKGDPICHVYHEWDEDAWQFLPNRDTEQSDAMIVCLKEVLKLDPTVGELADLPFGWKAERTGPKAPWLRSRNHPFSAFKDDGFYLDDASEYERLYPELYKIPSIEVRKGLEVGKLVKLIFRFADEWSERQDNDCERMWVEVLEVDAENIRYRGRLLNQPHLHTVINEGDELWFHPIHVFAIDA